MMESAIDSFSTMSSHQFRYSTTPQPPYAGYLTLLTAARSKKRFISISNTSLTYGHRPDKILWAVDLTECGITPKGDILCITIPGGKKVRLRLSKPELQAWYPRFMQAHMGLGQFYCVSARIGSLAGWQLSAGCDSDCGDDVRVWSVGKSDVSRCCCLAERDPLVLNICERIECAVTVVDVFEDSSSFHVVTDLFRGEEIKDLLGRTSSEALRDVVRDILTILVILHDAGLAHGALDDAVYVDESRAWVMVYGFAHEASRKEMQDDRRNLARLLRAVGGTELDCVIEMLNGFVAAREVLKDPWFRDGDVIDFDAVDQLLHTRDLAKVEIDSPRSIMHSANLL